jgi:hypothetical protein
MCEMARMQGRNAPHSWEDHRRRRILPMLGESATVTVPSLSSPIAKVDLASVSSDALSPIRALRRWCSLAGAEMLCVKRGAP